MTGATSASDRPRNGRYLRGFVQVLGFAVGVALLMWVVRSALSEENIRQFARLRESPWELVVTLALLSAATLAINGASFWVLLAGRKQHGEHARGTHMWSPAPFGDVQAINAVASLLSVLPFKISLMWRFYVHRRLHGLPVLITGAWIAAFGAVMLGVVGPVAACAWARVEAESGGLDAYLDAPQRGALLRWWWLLACSFVVVGMSLGLLIARWLTRGGPDSSRFRGVHHLAHMRGGRFVVQLAEGIRMLASGRVVAIAVLVRTADMLVQAGRFYVASRLVGMPLDIETAVLGASVFFLIEGIAPTGSLGVGEAGAAGALGKAAVPAILVVRGMDTLVRLGASAIALAWLKRSPRRTAGSEERTSL